MRISELTVTSDEKPTFCYWSPARWHHLGRLLLLVHLVEALLMAQLEA